MKNKKCKNDLFSFLIQFKNIVRLMTFSNFIRKNNKMLLIILMCYILITFFTIFSGGCMSKPNKNKFFASFVIIAGLILPIFLPAFIMMALVKFVPNEITHSGIMSLFILSFALFIIAGIFSKILSLVGLTEQKLDELGFLGLIISVLSSFFSIIVGYYWMKTFHLTSVELSSIGILIIAVITTFVLTALIRMLEKL